VHLQVGDTAKADRFYRDILGFDIAVNYPGASFYGSGGYHHQLAGNVWNSRQTGTRAESMVGLDTVEIILRDSSNLAQIIARAADAGIVITKHTDGTTLHDPWGTAIMLKV
jgi:catechol 2,3-dioxygenase